MATKEFEHSKRNNEIFSILMIDIDNFKIINDTYGGEEFIVLLVNTDREVGVDIAERFRKSIGVSSLTQETQSLDEVIIEADSALYEAKSKAKNCVVSS